MDVHLLRFFLHAAIICASAMLLCLRQAHKCTCVSAYLLCLRPCPWEGAGLGNMPARTNQPRTHFWLPLMPAAGSHMLTCRIHQLCLRQASLLAQLRVKMHADGCHLGLQPALFGLDMGRLCLQQAIIQVSVQKSGYH